MPELVYMNPKDVAVTEYSPLRFNFLLGFQDGKKFADFEKRIIKHAWSSVEGEENIPIVPIVKIPKNINGKHYFCNIDGSRRLTLSQKHLDCMPFYLFDKNEEIDFEEYKIKLFLEGRKWYDVVIETYKYYWLSGRFI